MVSSSLEWMAWLDGNWSLLANGGWVVLPGWLPHPGDVGFKCLGVAEDVGQVRNWVHALSDGSRLHVHEFAEGGLVVHRDRHNPDEGLVSSVLHFFLETKAGKVAGIALLAACALMLLVAGLRKGRRA